jgi:hypothetical protein
VLILDEPTAALGVKQSGVVLKYTAAARDAGLSWCSSPTTRTTRTSSGTTSSSSSSHGKLILGSMTKTLILEAGVPVLVVKSAA